MLGLFSGNLRSQLTPAFFFFLALGTKVKGFPANARLWVIKRLRGAAPFTEDTCTGLCPLQAERVRHIRPTAICPKSILYPPIFS